MFVAVCFHEVIVNHVASELSDHILNLLAGAFSRPLFMANWALQRVGRVMRWGGIQRTTI